MRRGEFFEARFEEHLEPAMRVALPALIAVAVLVAVLVWAAPFEYAGVRALLDLRRRNRRPGGRS